MDQGLYMESPIEQLLRFRKSNVNPDDLEIPEVPQNRQPTDKNYLIAFIVAIIVLVPFMAYTLMHADLKHFIETDNCGNLCGYKNEKVGDWNCTGQDFTDKPYLLIQLDRTERSCVEKCPPYQYSSCEKILDKNTAENLKGAVADIASGWWIIFLSMLITCSLCFGMIMLFKYAVDFLVWFLLIGSIGILAILAGVFWIAYKNYMNEPGKQETAKGFLSLAMTCSILVVFLIILITCMLKRIQLIIQLFKEAAKAIFEIPSLIYLPFLTFMSVFIAIAIFGSLTFYSISAGKLVELIPGYLRYEPDGVMIFTIIYNFLIYIWVMTFMNGAQYIIVAGAVSAWFFTRNKLYLEKPLWTSFMNFVKFHLGTVFVGSLIIALVSFIKMVLRGLASNQRTRWLVDCLCSPIMEFLKLFSRNAYIETALHGQPFFKSGKRALNLFVSNVENVVALNSIGNYIIAIAALLLVVVSSGISFLIARATENPQWPAIGVICSVLVFLMVSMFFSIFECTIDSIFVCFCEDTTLNDGMARPFFMTKGLHQFIENCKGVIPAKK